MAIDVQLFLILSLLHCSSILHAGGAEASTLDRKEVEALKVIAKRLGKKDWNFEADPCSWNRSYPIGPLWNPKENNFQDIINCTCKTGETICHVISIALKFQSLPGVVPPELANLTYLDTIELAGNYLHGSIPPELGSLTHLTHLSLGINRLSGHIPKELGNVSSLESLFLASNNLSGRLPRTLANMKQLEYLDIGSNQFHGTIPKRFSYLKSLQKFKVHSNNFSGAIPDFIRNWKNINVLRLEGNSLQGPIPFTISGLKTLTDIRISDLTGEGTNLLFMKNLMKLKIVVLRNALVYGEIPDFIGNFKYLKILDLRFNNLTGLIPNALESIKKGSLEFLYLGNNSLIGNLEHPPWSFDSDVRYIDLSYNNFSGHFPSWPTADLNLIENSFSINPANERSKGGPYLQRGFICEKGAPLHTSLAINCGGESLSTSDFISFEGDQNSLSPSSVYWEKNWAVSNTGHFYDSQNRMKFLVNTSHSQFTTGIHSELYMTARCSASSLRYYGLCLHNGPYKVQLHFAEIEFLDDKSFKSLGRRIFDVYIQGTIKLQNFNIEVDAGGRYKPIVKSFDVNVTDNYLEIHFLWAGKGTYDVPFEGMYGPLVSAIVVSSEFKIKNKSNNRTLIIGIISGIAISLGVAAFLSFIFIRKRKGTKNGFLAADVGKELANMNIISGTFTLEDIRSATNDFHIENKIGEGGFGAVFKGILPDGIMVAVKQMISKSRQGSREFLNELGTISAVQHPNLVKLYGCCIEGKQLLLVYEYMENNSLARALFGPQEFRLKLNWSERYNICLGVARGLAYLHEESRLRIIHRDIKATNILLDQHLNPKISDFGLAKLFDLEKTHVSTRVAGTIGYMAPEYALKGQLTEKADVYSFGVLVLEVVSGRAHTEKTLQTDMVYLLEWTWHLYEKNRLLDLVDVNLKSSRYSKEEVLRMINVGLLCTHATPVLRPSMSRVVGILEGKIEGSVSHSRPSYLGNWESSVHIEETANDIQEMPLTRSLSWEGPWNESSSASASSAAKKH